MIFASALKSLKRDFYRSFFYWLTFMLTTAFVFLFFCIAVSPAVGMTFRNSQGGLAVNVTFFAVFVCMVDVFFANDFFVRTNQPPHEGVVFEGHLLEGREVAESLIKSAKREIVLIDTYVGADTFQILEASEAGVAATIYTEKTGENIQTLQADHEREYGVGRHIEVMKYRTSFHDRFLFVDEDVYHIGASLKDLGKRLFAFDKMGMSKDLILSQVR